MFIFVGLANPKGEFDMTPHNIGGEVLKKIVEKNSNIFSTWENKKFLKSLSSSAFLSGEKINFLIPQTFMNNSGEIFQKMETIDLEKLFVVYDDIDLPFGQVRISYSRGSGGHNGIKSIENSLSSKNFTRIRIGVCPTNFFGKMKKPNKTDLNNYLVYKKMSKKHEKIFEQKIVSQVEKIIFSLVEKGRVETMNIFNQKN